MDRQAGLFREKRNTFSFDGPPRVPAKILVMGIGGIGTRSVRRMVEAKIPGVEFMAVDTDIRELRSSQACIKLEIGANITQGSGCGGNPLLGRKVALEEAERMLDLLTGTEMIFVIGGEGGGTFTGAAPIFTGLASEIGALAIAIATMPLSLQGATRRRYAETGIQELKEAADALITVSNEDLCHGLDRDALLEDTFSIAEDIFCRAVRDLTEIITKPGILNLELADMRAIMRKRGGIVIGTGMSEGPNRASEAVQRAITNPLLGDMPIKEAKSVLMNIAGSRQSLRLYDAKSAAKEIEDQADPEDMVIGTMYDDSLEDRLKITLIASGLPPDTCEPSDHLELHIGAKDDIVSIDPSDTWDNSVDFQNKKNWEELDRPAFRRRHVQGSSQ